MNPPLLLRAQICYHSVTVHDVIYVLYIHQSQLTKQWSVEQKMDVFPGQRRGALTVDMVGSLRYYFQGSAIICQVVKSLWAADAPKRLHHHVVITTCRGFGWIGQEYSVIVTYTCIIIKILWFLFYICKEFVTMNNIKTRGIASNSQLIRASVKSEL